MLPFVSSTLYVCYNRENQKQRLVGHAVFSFFVTEIITKAAHVVVFYFLLQKKQMTWILAVG